MTNSLIKGCEQPVVSRRKHHETPPWMEKRGGSMEFGLVVLDMLKNIDIQESVKRLANAIRERSEARFTTSRQGSPLDPARDFRRLNRIGFQAYPALVSARAEDRRGSANPRSNFKNLARGVDPDPLA